MLKLIAAAITMFPVLLCSAQVPSFTKYDIAKSGCQAYFPAVPEFQFSLSEDSSEVYTTDLVHGDFHYAVICVKFKEPMGADKAVNTELLKSYLDFLQAQFGIVSSVGYGEGHTLDSHPAATGVIDFWEDSYGDQWSVKGWIDGSYIGVMCIYGKSELNYNVSQMYLNGFRFPPR